MNWLQVLIGVVPGEIVGGGPSGLCVREEQQRRGKKLGCEPIRPPMRAS